LTPQRPETPVIENAPSDIYKAVKAYFEATNHPIGNQADTVAQLVDDLFELDDHPFVNQVTQLPLLAQVGVVCSLIERIAATPLVYQSDRTNILSEITVDTVSLALSIAPGVDCFFEDGLLVLSFQNGYNPEMPSVFEVVVTDVTQTIQVKTTFTRVFRLNVSDANHLADLLEPHMAI